MDNELDNEVRQRRPVEIDEEDEEEEEVDDSTEDEHIEFPVTNTTRPATTSFCVALLTTTVIIITGLIVVCQRSPITAVPVDDIVQVEFVGTFAMNHRLSKGKRIGMTSPESVVEDELGNLYTGLRDGRIVKIYPSLDGIIGEGEIVNMTNGQVLDPNDVTTHIGHALPLGLRLYNDTLYVMDAICGLYSINIISGDVKVFLRPHDVSPPLKFPNDLDIKSDGSTVYFTDSSSIHSIAHLMEEVLEGTCSGRLFKYNLKTTKLDVVVDNLCFANGVQLTKDQKMIMLAETSRYRVSWIEIKTWKPKHILRLPAAPDNIRKNKHGSYWVAASAKQTSLVRYLFGYPTLRQILVGMFSQSMLMSFVNRRHNMLFEVNDYGEIFDTWHDPNGNLTYALAQGTELSDGRIVLCTYAAPYLAIANKPALL